MKYIGFLILALMITGCSGSRQAADSNEALNRWITEGSYEIESQWASPMATQAFMAVANTNILGPGNTGNRISLIGNPNHLRIYNDSIDVDLPFYGERFMGAGYNQNNAGIQFKAPVKNYKVTTKNGFYQIKFVANDKTESYNVILNLFPNETASIAVNSSQRAAIRYQGNVLAFDPDAKEEE